MKLLCLDSSTVATFLLQEPGWQTVKRIVDSPDIHAALPGPVLTEVICVVRRRGNLSSPDQIAHTLAALGLAVMHPIDGDLVRAAQLIELPRTMRRLRTRPLVTLAHYRLPTPSSWRSPNACNALS